MHVRPEGRRREGLRRRIRTNEGENALAACERRKSEDDEASNALSEASLAPIVTGLGIAGALGLVVVLFYCCLWGDADRPPQPLLGVAGDGPRHRHPARPAAPGADLVRLLRPLLIVGKVPGGKPPAWEAGEAIPWPTPGERAAAELEPGEDAEETPADGSESADSERRKRKQRE